MSELEQGHGDSWHSIYEDMDTLMAFLPTAFTEATQITGKTITPFRQELNDTPTEEQIVGISYPLSENIGFAVLIHLGENNNEIISFYPYVTNGINLRLTLCDIQEMDNLIEAFITAEDENGISYRFLDTLYFVNKSHYVIGQSHEFNLSALAINIETVSETSIHFDEEQSLSFLAKTGQLTDTDEPIKPVVFDTSNMKAFFQSDSSLPHLTEFQSPIISIESISVHDIDCYQVHIMPTETLAEQNKALPIYFRQSLLSDPLQPDKPIRGLFLLQGYLIQNSDLSQ